MGKFQMPWKLCAWHVVVMAFLWLAGDLCAQPSLEEEVDALKLRLASLESQNAELRESVVARLPSVEETPTPSDAGYAVGSDLGMTAKWNHGLELQSKNKDFRVHIGGRTQIDVGWFSVDPNVDNNLNTPHGDGLDLRRARFRIDGTMYETMEWAIEYDFVNSLRVRNQGGAIGFFDEAVTAPTDVWWLFKELPILGNVKIGHQKEPVGFEHMVSSRFLPFMERSYNQDAFYGGTFNGFTTGISAYDNYGEDDMGLIHVGLFKPMYSVFATSTGDGDYSVVGRITRLLWYSDEGRGLFHVGLSGKQATAVSQSGVPGRIMTFRTRDAVRTGLSQSWPQVAGITLYGDDMQWVNGELVGVVGPWTFQAEYLVSGLQDARKAYADAPAGTAVYHGGYAQVLYFLTGEHDHYNKKTAAFDRVLPHENFFRVRDCDGNIISGSGAWQVGLRYDYLDLNDQTLNGGILHNYTVGLNWFLNPNTKIQFNYMATDRDAALAGTLGDGWIHGWGMRVAHDF